MEGASRKRTKMGARKKVPQVGSSSRPSRATSVPNPRVILPKYFSNYDEEQRYLNNYFSRNILEPRHLDESFFESQYFLSYVKFKEIGLLPFMTFKAPIYPELVRMFYSNLEITGNHIHSQVKNVDIDISEDVLFELTKLPSSGALFDGEHQMPDEWKSQYNLFDAKRMICKPNSKLTQRLLAGQLDCHCRLMHYFYIKIMNPRRYNLAQISESDIIVLWALLNEFDINWANFVRWKMTTAKRSDAELPYGHWITRFMEHSGVPLEGEEFNMIQRRQTIDANTVAKMGIILVNGMWQFKDDPPQTAPSQEAEPSQVPASSSEVSNSQLMDEIRNLGNRVDRFEHNIGLRMNLFENTYATRMNHLESNLNDLRTHLGHPPYPPYSSFDPYQPYPPPPDASDD